MPKRCQNLSPKGDKNPSKIVKKSSLSRRGLPQATCDLPEGTPPPQGPKIHRMLHEFRSKLWQSTATHCASKTQKKMAGAPSCICCFGGSVSAGRVLGTPSHSKTPKKNGGRTLLYFLLWGERLRRQSTGYSLSLQNSKKKWRALPPVFLALRGASPQTEYWLRNDAMPHASQKKEAPLKQKKSGRSTLSFIFCGVPKKRQSAGRLSKKTPLTGSGNPKARWRFGACAFGYIPIRPLFE